MDEAEDDRIDETGKEDGRNEYNISDDDGKNYKIDQCLWAKIIL